MRLYVYIVLFLLLCTGLTAGFNYNIFRWPTFKFYKVPGPLQGLAEFKSRAFSHFEEIKKPIVKGFRELKNHVLDFKKSIFEKAEEVKGEISSYHRRPKSHYGNQAPAKANYGYFRIALQPPSSEYGTPEAPSQGYGAPSVPSQSYGTPPAPSQSYGTPPAPSQSYGAPPAPSQSYGAPPSPSQSYGAPPAPSQSYRTPNPPSSDYGPPLASNNFGFGAPQPQSLYSPPQSPNPTGYRPPPLPSSNGGHNTQLNTNYLTPTAVQNNNNNNLIQHNFIRPQPINNNNAYNNNNNQQQQSFRANQRYQQNQQNNQNFNSINAPLSAAMAMGHILTEDEVILVGDTKQNTNSFPNDSGKWKPLFRPSPSLPVAQRLTSNNNINVGQQYNANNNNANSNIPIGNNQNVNTNGVDILFVGDGSDSNQYGNISNSVLSGSNNRLINNIPQTNIQEVLPVNSFSSNTLSSQPNQQNNLNQLSNVITFRNVSRSSTATNSHNNEGSNILFLNNNVNDAAEQEHLSNAEKALSQLVDQTILPDGVIRLQPISNSLPPSLQPRNLVSRSSPQEELFSIQQVSRPNDPRRSPRFDHLGNNRLNFARNNDNNNLGGGPRQNLASGQQGNQPFSVLMEDFELNVMTDLIRRANLQAMLTTQGKYTNIHLIFTPQS